MLRRRYPGLAHLHDDLVGKVQLDLVGSYQVDSSRPESPEVQAVLQARTILRRRLADLFRRPIREFAHATDIEDTAGAASSPDDRAHFAEATRFLLGQLSALSTLEQRLVLDQLGRTLSASERKQRQRLKERLRVSLEERFGPLGELLGDD